LWHSNEQVEKQVIQPVICAATKLLSLLNGAKAPEERLK